MTLPSSASPPVALAAAVALACGGAAAQEPPRLAVAAPPGAVTVFPDQASVTRTGVVDLPAGDSLLVLSPVPAGLLRDSVTARGRAEAAVEIGAVEVRQTAFDPRPTERRRAELAERLRALEDEIAAVDVRLAGWAAQLALIERLGAGFADGQRRPPPPAPEGPPRAAADPATWRAAWEAVRGGSEEAGEATRLARIARRELEARRAAVQAEIAALGTPPAGALEIVVAVRAEAATRFELSVGYQVPGAAWRPVYAARLDSAAGRLALRQEAIVTQRTGEDWDGVTLALSTARPAAEARPPELRPWRIALLEPERERARRESVAPAGRVASALPASPAPAAQIAPAPVVREAEAPAAVIASTGFAVEYRIPGRATIRTDGTERRVRVGDSTAEAVMVVRAVPRLDPRGFLEARVVNPAPAPLLPGRASLYLDGVLVGTAALPLLRPQEEITLPFGADDQVRITYVPQGLRRGTEGSLLTGRSATRSAEALITVRNYHSRPMEITILDQMPVSGDEQLTVTLAAEPAPSVRDLDGRPGVLAWTATYAAGEERRIRLGWTVSAPRDREILGLER